MCLCAQEMRKMNERGKTVQFIYADDKSNHLDRYYFRILDGTLIKIFLFHFCLANVQID